jgi:hypothetical protein
MTINLRNMRKSLILLFLVAFATWSSYGQIATSYNFASTVGTYTAITGGTLWQSGSWDDATGTVPLGFNFTYNGSTVSSLLASCNGYLTSYTGSLGYSPISSATSTPIVIAGMGRDLQGQTGSEIRYETTGTAPNRVFTLQWTDAKRYGTSYAGELIDFQIKLYETTNKIEFVYGSVTGSSYASAIHPQVGLRGSGNTDYFNRTTTTDWTASTQGTANTATMTLNNVVYPPSGLTYTFTVKAPAAPTAVSPANGAINVDLTATLNWAAGTGAGPTAGYKIYFGTDNPPTNIANGVDLGSVVTYDPNPDMVCCTNYYWRLESYGPGGNTMGPVWSFTTMFPPGILTGWVRNSMLNPIIGATVTAGVYTATTGAGGEYTFLALPAQTYTVTCMATGYNTATATGVVITSGGTTNLDFTLTNPTMTITPNPFDVTVNPEEYYTQNMYILNQGSGELNWDATVTYPPGDNANIQAPVYPVGTGGDETSRVSPSDPPANTDAVGDILASFVAPAGITLPWGCGVDNGDLLITDPSGNPTKIFRVSTDGTLLGSVTCALGGTWIGDMAPGPAGSIFAVNVGGDNKIYQINPTTGATISSITGAWATISARGLAYDAEHNEFWIGGWNHSVIYHVSSTGATISTIPFSGVSGLAWHKNGNGGTGSLWVVTNAAASMVYELAPTGTILHQFAIPGTATGGAGVEIDEGGMVWIVNQANRTVYKMDSGTPIYSWFTLDDYSGVVPAMTNYALPAHFNAAGIPSGTVKYATVTFVSDPAVGTWDIPVSMTVQGEPLSSPENLEATLVNQFTGEVLVSWDAAGSTGLLYYAVNRDGAQIGTTTGTSFTDMLPTYGTYSYTVQAVYAAGSGMPAGPVEVEWPNPTLVLNPTSLTATVWANHTKDVPFMVGNVGEGTLAFQFPDYMDDDAPLAYCTATASYCDEYIGKVTVGSIDNSSGCSYYANYTAISTDLDAGESYPITVLNGGNAYSSDYVKVWIDFNHDETFADAEGFMLTTNGGGTNFTGTITVPETAPAGVTRMRVRMSWASTPVACGTQSYGEVEDYSVNVIQKFITQVYPAQGTVASGDETEVKATFSAMNSFATPGTYTQSLLITTNDLANASVSIPCTMIVIVPGMISGTVTDCVTGELLQGVMVNAGPYTAMTDDNGTYTLECEEGTYAVSFTKIGYQMANVPSVVVTSGNTTVVDATLCEMPYAPGCASAVVNATDTQCDVTWCVPMGPYELLYDDGTAENFAAWQLAGNLNAVKFTPEGYPATVVGGLFYVGDGSFPAGGNIIGSTFTVRVFDDDGTGGLPGTDLSGDGVVAEVMAPGWVTVTGLNVTIASGSFYLAMEQGTNEPNCAPIGVDETLPKAYKSYSKFVTAGGDWVLSAYQDFMIHAIVDGPVADDDAVVTGDKMIVSKESLAGVISQHTPYTLPGYEMAAQLTSPEAYATDAVNHYKLWRISAFDPNGSPAAGTFTPLADDLTSNSYVDGGTTWINLPQGWYAYCIKAVYPNGQESECAFTNVVGHKMMADVTINVQLVCGFVPAEGAMVQMVGLDYPYETYSATVPASGTVNFTVWQGNYTVQVTYPGYLPFVVNYNINGPRTIDVILEDEKFAPRNLYVDGATLVATWEAPLFTLLDEDFESTTFPPSGWSATTSGAGWFGTTNGSSTFFSIPAHTRYACANDDANSSNNGCCDYLITPGLDLSVAPGFVMTFASYFTGVYGGTATVELSIDGGSTWSTIFNVPSVSSWTTHTIDLSAYAGPGGLTNALIAFHYNDNGAWADGWGVDDAMISTGVDPTYGYGVFLDGALVGNTNETTWTFNPSAITWGQTYVAGVAGLYCSGYSDMVTYTFTSSFLFPPRNLQGAANDNAAILTWEAPLSGDYALGAIQPRTEMPNANAEYSPTYAPGTGNYTDAMWDILLSFPLDVAGHAGVGTDGNFIYATIWSGGGFTKYDLAGNYVEDFTISGVNSIRDLAYNPDNGHFYGSPNSSTLYEMDFTNKVLVGSVSTGVSAIRHIAYDPTLDGGNGGFWAGGWADDYKITMSGSVIGATTGFNLSAVYGTAYDDQTDGGPYIWYYDQNGSGVDLHQYSIASSAFTGVVKSTTDIPGYSAATAIAGGLEVSTTMVTGKAVILGLIQQDIIFVYELTEASGPPPVSGNLVSYIMYRDGSPIAEIPKTELEYWDMNLDPATYCYEVTAKYDMTDFGFPGVFAESGKEGPACVDVFYGFGLPFIEDWTAGTFDLNAWTAGENWVVDGQLGNPYPSAKFKWDPILTDYSSSLESWWINGASVNTTTPYKIWFDFDLLLNDRTSSANEMLNAEVWNGTSWKVVGEYANNGSFDWATQHIDITSKAKDKVFKIRFNANGAASNDIYYWLVDNVKVYVEYQFNPPQTLVATPAAATGTIVNDNHLTWVAPEGGGGGSTHPPVWIHWDSGENSDAIGTGGAADFDVAARFDVSQLEEYDGMAVTKVAFWPNEAACEYSIRVWQGDMAANLLVDQVVSSPTIGAWNEVDLDTPLTIDVSQELWFGVRCNATAGYPAGCDAGPQVPDYGQWIYWSGAWSNLVDLNSSLTFNWNLQAYLESADDDSPVQTPIVLGSESRNTTGALAMANYETPANAVFAPAETNPTDAPMDLMGYNVYRRQYVDPIPGTGYTTLSDWAMINTSLVTATEYWDSNLPNNCYDYYVTAVYTEGESEPSNIDAWNCIVVGVNDVEASDVRVYPNPATSYVNIDLTKDIRSIAVYNALGSVVMQKNITGESTVILHTTNYAAGAYNVKFVKANGDTFSRKFVVVK